VNLGETFFSNQTMLITIIVGLIILVVGLVIAVVALIRRYNNRPHVAAQ